MEQSKLSTNTNGSYGYSSEKNETFESNSEGNSWFGSEFDNESNVLDKLKVLSKKYDSPEKVEGLFKKLKNFDFTVANKSLLIQICQALFAAKGSALADQKILINNFEALYYTAVIVNNFASWSFEFSGVHNGIVPNERFFLQLYTDLFRAKSIACLQDHDDGGKAIPFENFYDFDTLDKHINQHLARREKILALNDKLLLIAIIAMQNVAKSDEVMNVIAMVCGIVPQERIEFYSIATKNNSYIVDHNMQIYGATISTRFTVDKNLFLLIKKSVHEEDNIALIRLTNLLNNRAFIGVEDFSMLSSELFDSYLNSARAY